MSKPHTSHSHKTVYLPFLFISYPMGVFSWNLMQPLNLNTFLLLLISLHSGVRSRQSPCLTIAPEAEGRLNSFLDRSVLVPFAGLLRNDTGIPFKNLPIPRPAPCGHDSYLENDLQSHYVTGIHLYQFDPSGSPGTTLVLDSIELSTTCRQYWFQHDIKELLSSFPIPFTSLNIPDLASHISRYQEKAASLELNKDYYDYLAQDPYNCPVWSFTGKSTIKAIRYKRLLSTWSLSGHLLDPIYSPQCKLNSGLNYCNTSRNQIIMWEPQKNTPLLIKPTVVLTGILETVPDTKPGCLNITRFISPLSRFQLTLGNIRVSSLIPEAWFFRSPVFLSKEGHIFSFLLHQGQPIFFRDCPEWEFQFSSSKMKRSLLREDSPNLGWMPKLMKWQDSRQLSYVRKPRGLSQAVVDFPLEFRAILLAENAAWTTSEVLNQIGELSNRTVREIVELHFRRCVADRFSMEIAKTIISLDERVYLEKYFGHPLFSSSYRNGQVFYKLAHIVKKLSVNYNTTLQKGFQVAYELADGSTGLGFLQCGTGLITEDPLDGQRIDKTCYLPLVRYGGIDLCSGTLVTSVDVPLKEFSAWAPRIELPTITIKDPTYHQKLLTSSFRSLSRDPGNLNQLSHELARSAYFPSLQQYISLWDEIIRWAPVTIFLICLLYVLKCSCERPTIVKSTWS